MEPVRSRNSSVPASPASTWAAPASRSRHLRQFSGRRAAQIRRAAASFGNLICGFRGEEAPCHLLLRLLRC